MQIEEIVERIINGCSLSESLNEEGDPSKIKVKHTGILEIPEDKKFIDMPISHFVDLAKSKGRAEIVRALNNLVRWHSPKSKSPDEKIVAKANKAKEAIEKAFEKEENK